MQRSVVTITRQWHAPQITTRITNEEISVSVALPDFLEALTRELGPVTWVFTDRAFKVKFDAAVERVLQGIKDETAKVV
jgi:hypothetical protein